MTKNDFMRQAEDYIVSVKEKKEFKLNDILGEDCPTLPGKWLYEEVEIGTFNTSEYIIEFVKKDSSDTYIKNKI